MLAITIVAIPSFARLVRSLVLGVREWSFVEAARSLGANDRRLIWQHILPNTVSPVAVYGTFETGETIVFAAALSFSVWVVAPVAWSASAGQRALGLFCAPSTAMLAPLIQRARGESTNATT